MVMDISANNYFRFRWAECQLNSLPSCPCSPAHLDRLLNSLPQSLDETYERMLCNIRYDLRDDARRILTLLGLSSRPLSLRELIDGIAVQIDEPHGLNKERRLENGSDIHDICPGFIDISHDDQDQYMIQIVHFSIQEYLESSRIRQQKAVFYSLVSQTAHTEIAQICLVYLLEHDLAISELNENVLEKYPLAHFAATYWFDHYRNMRKSAPEVEHLVLRLFQRKISFTNWVKLYDVDKSWKKDKDFHRSLNDIADPIYYASLLGLDQVLQSLISAWQFKSNNISTKLSTLNLEVSKIINAQGGEYGNALQAASVNGHEAIVQLLLNHGADINAQGGEYGNALQAARSEGHEKIVQLLLENGATPLNDSSEEEESEEDLETDLNKESQDAEEESELAMN